MSYLLQRIETFDGIAILASNKRDNIDEAFARRFESIIYFPMPRPEERLRLRREGFSPQTQLEPGLSLQKNRRGTHAGGRCDHERDPLSLHAGAPVQPHDDHNGQCAARHSPRVGERGTSNITDRNPQSCKASPKAEPATSENAAGPEGIAMLPPS